MRAGDDEVADAGEPRPGAGELRRLLVVAAAQGLDADDGRGGLGGLDHGEHVGGEQLAPGMVGQREGRHWRQYFTILIGFDKNRAPRVLLVGAYERDNFGDLLFLLVTERYLDGAEIVAAAPFAADMRDLLGRHVPAYGPLLHAEPFDAIWTVGGQVGTVDVRRAYRMSASPAAWRRFAAGTEAERLDRLRQEVGETPLVSPYIPLPFAFPRNAGAVTVLNSVGIAGARGIEPLRREAVFAALRGATAIAVRDLGSSRLLSDLGIDHRLAPDAVHALGVLDPPSAIRMPTWRSCRSRAPGCAGSGTRASGPPSPPARSSRGGPSASCSPGPPPAMTPSTTTSGRAAPRAASTSTILDERRPLELVDHIRRARVVVGTSLHVRIVAAAYGVPRVSLSKPKPTRYARLWDPDMPFDVALEGLDAAIEAALARGRRPEAAEHAAGLSLAAHENLEALARLVRVPGPGEVAQRVADRHPHQLAALAARLTAQQDEIARASARPRAEGRARPMEASDPTILDKFDRQCRVTGVKPSVSVIVPVFNPGANIDECIDSLLGQTMPAGELELIFVDDGSTDATPARLDALAAEHAHVRVERIPNSGWPGRPRNLGMDLARGEFVYFVDNDDWLELDAIERMHATALRDGADVVIGKVVGHGKTVPRELFRESLHAVPFDSVRLLALLTPHKLFRREMLVEHGIRFPEGRRRLEDHLFVVHAYFHATAISVLADRPCYHWALRDRAGHASHQRLDPVGYFGNVREVLDVVCEHTEPGAFRDSLLAHWYRGKMLGRVGGSHLRGAPAPPACTSATPSASSRSSATTRASTRGWRSTCGCAPCCCATGATTRSTRSRSWRRGCAPGSRCGSAATGTGSRCA